MIGCKETSFNGCAIGLIKKWPWEQYPHGRSISTLSCAKPLTKFWWDTIRAVTTRVASRDGDSVGKSDTFAWSIIVIALNRI